MTTSLIDSVRTLLGELEQLADPGARRRLQDAAVRLDEPLRVAFAGRIKAGKSTLLNALIGAPIAASDAAECTRFVTWYTHGPHPIAYVVDRAGNRTQVPYRIAEGIDVSSIDPDDVDRLEVEYPSPALESMTLIDTPGIASISEAVSERSTAFLTPESGNNGADVLIYLLRYLHERDGNFWEALTDPLARSNDPVGSVAVLSRADEFGAGRGDWLQIAERAAATYRERHDLRTHVSDVIAVSGLVGLHAERLSQRDFDDLKEINQLALTVQEDLLLSVDRFATLPSVESPPERRADLVDRFGLAGIRLALALIRSEAAESASELADLLVEVSGIVPLRRLILERFALRSDALRASHAMTTIRAVVADGLGGREVQVEVERIEANSHELAELTAMRNLEQLRDAGIRRGFSEQQHHNVGRALGASGMSLHERLGVDPATDGLADVARERIFELRSLSNSRLLARPPLRVVDTAVRSLEIALDAHTPQLTDYPAG